MGNPRVKYLSPIWLGYGTPSTTESILINMPRVLVYNDSLINLSMLKIQSSPLWKQRSRREGRARDGSSKLVAVVNLNFHFNIYLKTKASEKNNITSSSCVAEEGNKVKR